MSDIGIDLNVDPWLVGISCAVPLLLIFINTVVIAHFLHPEDAGGAKFPKVVVLIGMVVAESAVLLLPLDVGNKGGLVGCGYWNDKCGGLDMDLVWQLVYVVIAGMVVVIVPYTIFYYEADDREGNKGERIWWTAFKYLIVTLVVSILILVISFVFLRETYIPVSVLSVSVGTTGAWVPTGSAVTVDIPCGGGAGCVPEPTVLNMQVTFVIYLAALLSFVGWFLFVIYGGIGMIALPMDLINGFIHRRKLLSDKGVARFKLTLQKRCEILLEMGERMKEEFEEYDEEKHSRYERRKQQRLDEITLNKYAVLVAGLEEDAENMRMSSPTEFKKNNALTPWVKLLLGIISVIVSLCWVLHIVLYMLLDPPATPFLNDYLTWFDSWFPLFGTITVGVFAMYLLVAVTKGNMKFGSRFFLVKVHPLVAHKTFVNAMLFNLALVLLCVLPVVQFASDAFADYSRLTSSGVLFGSQIKHMEFFRHFFENKVFLYALLGVTAISLVYFIMSPNEKKRLRKEEEAHRAALGKERDQRLRARERARA